MLLVRFLLAICYYVLLAVQVTIFESLSPKGSIYRSFLHFVPIKKENPLSQYSLASSDLRGWVAGAIEKNEEPKSGATLAERIQKAATRMKVPFDQKHLNDAAL